MAVPLNDGVPGNLGAESQLTREIYQPFQIWWAKKVLIGLKNAVLLFL